MDDASRAHIGVSPNGQALGQPAPPFRPRKPLNMALVLDSIVFFVVLLISAAVALYGAGRIGGAVPTA